VAVTVVFYCLWSMIDNLFLCKPTQLHSSSVPGKKQNMMFIDKIKDSYVDFECWMMKKGNRKQWEADHVTKSNII